ncbi:MCE family protein [Solirubrobacter sp. CPCC 204708]|uniref:MlaD family protein n=1 Tax=Solirubrobacter deserti TaxID=2282478 RepID=A0ABT4RG28_9ACTN|nr:MlaD family protein [Solirubrobacter deserti]MBE2318220.1 MCE family protein [Solirubrobacter deserti]MDA0137501.1 MlaD family protein [Solirubrobacter deserti]
MIRFLAGLAIVAVIAVGAFLIFGNREDDGAYRVRAIFDNAGFVIPGEDVKIAGVRVGKIASIDVTEDFKAAVVLEITEPGYRNWKRDASCIVRPQNLIGERFVECKPTQVRSANAEPPPDLDLIESGPGEGQRLVPVENTSQSVDIDLIGNTMREPERERLSLILNELGTGLAGRGRDLNDVIRRANPALRETDRVLEILARQNTVLEQLAVNSDTVLAPLARDRRQVASAIRNSSRVAEATAERREDLAADIETLPEFLDEFDPTMERLGSLADESTPLLTDLGARADDINNVVRRLGPFSEAAIPAIDSLGEAAQTGTPALTEARPVIADLRSLANDIRPVGTNLRGVLESFRDTDGIQRLMDYIFFQVAAINGYDATGHYLRAGLLVNQCTTYAVRPVAGCTANYPPAAGASAATARASSAVDGVGEDPVLRATAIAIARALGQQVEQEKAKIDRTLTAKKPGGKAEAPAGAAPRIRGAAPTATATATAPPSASPVEQAPAPAPSSAPTTAPPAAETPAPTAAPPTPTAPAPTATPDPGEGLLDFLFGEEGG